MNTPKQCLARLIAAAIQKSLLHFEQRNPGKLVGLKCYLKTRGLDTDPHKLFRSRLSRLYQFSSTLWLPIAVILSCFFFPNSKKKRHGKLIKVLHRVMTTGSFLHLAADRQHSVPWIHGRTQPEAFPFGISCFGEASLHANKNARKTSCS